MLILSLIHVQQKKHIYFNYEIDMLNCLRQIASLSLVDLKRRLKIGSSPGLDS